MITQLQDRIAKYMTRNASTSEWRSMREYYARYLYLTFMCLIANDINPDCEVEGVGDILCDNFLEDVEIVRYVLATGDSTEFMREITDLMGKQKIRDMNEIYQGILAGDFILKDDRILFDRSKNNRDILGSYYTQERFAYEITEKTIMDYCRENNNVDLRIADYACGGGAFLVSACKVCRENGIVPKLYGYDVDPIAVLITRFRLLKEAGLQADDSCILLGNPLLRNEEREDLLSIFKCAVSGRFYNTRMGIISEQNMDIIIGNPPWEKIRFEEKKFLHHFAQDTDIETRAERRLFLQKSSQKNKEYYNEFLVDYESAKLKIKKDTFYEKSSCGELNTYALFTELCLNSLGETGTAGIIIKSSLVKMPVYSEFFKKLMEDHFLYELYMFVNRNKIFSIDSREEFSVIFLKNGNNGKFGLALNLDNFESLDSKEKIYVSSQLLNELNPDTGMIPNISSDEELEFLISMYGDHRSFDQIYPESRFGRLVHLTNHSESIVKSEKKGYLPIYEGKFIEIYTGKFATFRDMSDSEKYKNKATARTIEDVDGDEYPQSRYYIRDAVWKSLSKNFAGNYVIAWRSLTSATNRRTMLATILPLIPTCQSIQLLQLSKEKMLHVLALFNSIVFDYIVRLKMAGLDLTQTIIKQMPVPDEACYYKSILFKGTDAAIEVHINSRMKELYKSDQRIRGLFTDVATYQLQAGKTRKEIIAEIDSLVAILYSIDEEELRKIALSFPKYYSEKEVERLF